MDHGRWLAAALSLDHVEQQVERRDFFISYTQVDGKWAEWIAWQLEEAGYSTILQAWDFGPGQNFILEMHKAARSCERTLLVLSPDFLESEFAESEWSQALARDPGGTRRSLLPIRVRPCEPQGLLGPVVFKDLVGFTEDRARAELLRAVQVGRRKPEHPPAFPGGVAPTFPGRTTEQPTRSSAPPGRDHGAAIELVAAGDAERKRMLVSLGRELLASYGYDDARDNTRYREDSSCTLLGHSLSEPVKAALCIVGSGLRGEPAGLPIMLVGWEAGMDVIVADILGMPSTPAVVPRRASRTLRKLGPEQIVERLVARGVLVAPDEVRRRVEPITEGRSATSPRLLVHRNGYFWWSCVTDPLGDDKIVFVHADGVHTSAALGQQLLSDARAVQGLTGKSLLVAASADAAAAARVDGARQRYLNYLLDECRNIQLDGLPADGDVISRPLALEALYVPLRLKPVLQESRVAAPLGPSLANINGAVAAEWLARTEKLSLLAEITRSLKMAKQLFVLPVPAALTAIIPGAAIDQILVDHPHIAVLAAPGSGKTTLLKHLTLSAAGSSERSVQSSSGPRELPILIRCRDLGHRCRDPLLDTLRALPALVGFDDDANESASLVVQALRDGSALVMLDGLDEIADTRDRKIFVERLRAFISLYPGVRLVLTSREAGFRAVAGALANSCEPYEISPLLADDIKQLVQNWYREVGGHAATPRDADDLIERILENKRIRELAQNPLLLTTLLLVKRWLGQLPTKRSVLYGKAVDVLLATWNVQAHEPIDPDEAIPQLAYLAFVLMKTRRQRIDEVELRHVLEQARRDMDDMLGGARTSVTEFVRRIELRSSLLVQVGHDEQDGNLIPIYEFRHLTFQEYLAAVAMAKQHLPLEFDSDSIDHILAPHFQEPSWEKVIPLAAVLAGRREAPRIVAALLSALREQLASTTPDLEGMQLLAERLIDCLVDEVSAPPQLVDQALECVVTTWFKLPVGWPALLSLAKQRHGWQLALSVTRAHALSDGGPECTARMTAVVRAATAQRSASELSELLGTLDPTLRTMICLGSGALWAEHIKDGQIELVWREASTAQRCALREVAWSRFARDGVLGDRDLRFLAQLTVEGARASGDALASDLELICSLITRCEWGELATLADELSAWLPKRSETAVTSSHALALAYLTGSPWSFAELVERVAASADALLAEKAASSAALVAVWRQIDLLNRLLAKLGREPSRYPSTELTLIPLREVRMFPDVTKTLDIGRQRSIAAVESLEGQEHPTLIACAHQNDREVEEPGPDDCYARGVVVQINKVTRHSNDSYSLEVLGLRQVELETWTKRDPFNVVRVTPVALATKLNVPAALVAEVQRRSVEEGVELVDLEASANREQLANILAGSVLEGNAAVAERFFEAAEVETRFLLLKEALDARDAAPADAG